MTVVICARSFSTGHTSGGSLVAGRGRWVVTTLLDKRRQRSFRGLIPGAFGRRASRGYRWTARAGCRFCGWSGVNTHIKVVIIAFGMRLWLNGNGRLLASV